ncbi:creatininase, partial [Arthrobacter sp. H-02-3]
MTISTTAPASNISELERLKVLHNGQKEKLTFSNAEFERRLGGLRRIMAEKDLDAV